MAWRLMRAHVLFVTLLLEKGCPRSGGVFFEGPTRMGIDDANLGAACDPQIQPPAVLVTDAG